MKVMRKVVFAGSLFSLLLVGAVFLSSVPAAAQFGGGGKRDTTRLLLGKVLDGNDGPLPNAVVYLTNTRDHSVKTYIVGPDGTYRFPALQPTLDYEVYAQYEKRKSRTKSVSQFDDRSQVYIDLKIEGK
jgi:Carboxypeptidase regulatory-like domain